MLINIAGTHFGHICILHIHIFRVYVVSGHIYFQKMILMNEIYVIQIIWHVVVPIYFSANRNYERELCYQGEYYSPFKHQ